MLSSLCVTVFYSASSPPPLHHIHCNVVDFTASWSPPLHQLLYYNVSSFIALLVIDSLHRGFLRSVSFSAVLTPSMRCHCHSRQLLHYIIVASAALSPSLRGHILAYIVSFVVASLSPPPSAVASSLCAYLSHCYFIVASLHKIRSSSS